MHEGWLGAGMRVGVAGMLVNICRYNVVLCSVFI